MNWGMCNFFLNRNSRHVNWDDYDNEQEEYNEEEIRWMQQQKERQEILRIAQLDEEAGRAWEKCRKRPQHWQDFLTLPYNSGDNDVIEDMVMHIPNILPHGEVDTFSSFLAGWKVKEGSYHGRKFREEILGDSIRLLLEESDRISGFQLLTDFTNGFFSGLATSVLEELGDECKSAGRWCIGVDDFEMENAGIFNYFSSSSKYEQRKQFRKNINRPLSMHGLIENSDLFLPLDISRCSCESTSTTTATPLANNLFYSGSIAAVLLESATLSYRLNLNCASKARVATAGRGMCYDSKDYISRQQRCSFQDFVSSLLPSQQYGVISLSGVMSMSESKFIDMMSDGTSMSYINLMKSNSSLRHRFTRENLGKWLSCPEMIRTLPSSNLKVGLSNRRLHTHFALLSSIRFSSTPQYTVEDSVNCQMESFTQFRLDRYTSCSILHSLTQSIGKGNYWNRDILPLATQNTNDTIRKKEKPVMSLLENSSLCYPFLQKQTENLELSLERKIRGLYMRDEIEGLLLNIDESMEASEFLLTLSDTYNPGIDDHIPAPGEFYEGNED